MKKPPILQPGNKIGILCTARKIDKVDLQPCLDTLAAWGLEAVFAKHLFEAEHQFAGPDAHRLQDLQTMLDDPSINCILCARGGYGTTRILDGVDFSGLQKNPKWIIGFSDLTPLLNECMNKGVESIHGPMSISFGGKTGDVTSIEYLRQLLMEEELPKYVYAPQRQDLIRPGKATAPLTGGNLTLLSHITGTPTDFDPAGTILMIEDLDEYLYNIDRMIIQLKRAGKFANLVGLIVGGMSDMKDNTIPFGKTAEEIVADAVKEFEYPVAYNFPFGHQEKNYPIVIGRQATLSVSHVQVQLSFEK